jgi:hypothetical protein
MVRPITNAQESTQPTPPPTTQQPTPATQAAPQQAEISQELAELVVIPDASFVADDIKETTAGLEFESVTIKSEYTLGTEIQSDFMVKQKTDDTTQIEREIDSYRTGFLHNLENAPSVTKDKPEVKKSTKGEIDTARDRINKDKSSIKEAKFLVKTAQKDATRQKLEKNKKLKEIKEQPVKKATPDSVQTQSPTPETSPAQPATQASPQNPKKMSYWMEKLNPSLKAEAQATTVPDWVPDFSSVNFFDTDEVGTWVHSDWKTITGSATTTQPSVAFGNGRMYVAIKTLANKVAVGSFDSNGNDPKPFVVIGDTTQSPTIEFYYGRVYVGIIGANNIPYYKYSSDGGTTWTNWVSMGGNVQGIDFERLGNSLYAGARGMDNRMFLNQMDNGSNAWTGWAIKGTQLTIDKPVLAAHNNTIYFGFRASNNKALVNRNALNWVDTNNKEAFSNTGTSFGMASIGTKLCFLFRAPLDELLQGCSENDIASAPYLVKSNESTTYAPTLGKDWNLSQLAVVGNVLKLRNLGFSLNTRGYLTEMLWDTPSTFGVNSTYEQDIFLYNGPNYTPANTTYLSKSTESAVANSNPPKGCKPITNYVTSTLPSWYLDTRVTADNPPCDNETSEISYTIGSSRANEIIANKQYINYLITGKGARNLPVFKLIAQRGEMRPDWCFNRLLCLSSIPSGNRYSCNDNSGDTWCSWSTDIKIITPNDDYLTNLNRTATYPYWYWTYSK